MIVLYPIKPEYVEKILSGVKLFELRKRLPKKHIEQIVIYSTYPDSAIVGLSEVEQIYSGSPKEIWNLVSKNAGISSTAYDDYFSEASTAYAIELKNVRRFVKPFDISVLGDNITVPQSFCYLDKGTISRIKRRKMISV